MANVISNRCLTLMAEGSINLETDTIRVALMTSSYTEDKDTNTFDNTNEVSGTGYTAGGATLANSTVTQDDTNDRAIWDADDVQWTSSTITARYAVVYDVTASDTILLVVDFGSDESSSDDSFTIQWNAVGIAAFAQSA